MKRVFAVAGKAMLLEVPEPELRAGEVLVSPAYSVISSGTEMHIIHSSADPRTLGDDTYPSLRQPNPPNYVGGVFRTQVLCLGPSALELHHLDIALLGLSSRSRPRYRT